MKTIIVFFFFLIFCFLKLHSQNKLEFYSINIGMGINNLKDKNDRIYPEMGIGITADVSLKYSKNIFTFYYEQGSPLRVFSSASDSYRTLNLNYGREFYSDKKVSYEGQIGLGYFNFRINYSNPEKKDISEFNLSIPLRFKLMINFGKHFGMGFNFNYNLNSIANLYSINLLFQFKFKKVQNENYFK